MREIMQQAGQPTGWGTFASRLCRFVPNEGAVFSEDELRLASGKFEELLPDSPDELLSQAGRREFLAAFRNAIDFVAGLGRLETMSVRLSAWKSVPLSRLISDELRVIDDHFHEIFGTGPDEEAFGNLKKRIVRRAGGIEPSFDERGVAAISGLMLIQYLHARADLFAFPDVPAEKVYLSIHYNRINVIRDWFRNAGVGHET